MKKISLILIPILFTITSSPAFADSTIPRWFSEVTVDTSKCVGIIDDGEPMCVEDSDGACAAVNGDCRYVDFGDGTKVCGCVYEKSPADTLPFQLD